MKNLDIIVAGDINLDIILSNFTGLPQMGQELFVENMTVTIGGSAANTAIGLAKLGVKVALYGVVSKDRFGQYILEELERLGICTDLMEVTEQAETGISICLTSGQDRAFITYMGNNKLYNPEKLLEKSFQGRHIHFAGFNWRGLMASYEKAIKELKRRGFSLSLDVGYDQYEQFGDKMKEILANIHLFFPNEVEALKLTGAQDVFQALDRLSALVPLVVITRGSQGAIAKDENGIWEHPAFQVEAVDAVGAGDAFSAGFLYGYLKNESTAQCLLLGSACGALAAAGFGGGAAAPELEKLEQFISSNMNKKTTTIRK